MLLVVRFGRVFWGVLPKHLLRPASLTHTCARTQALEELLESDAKYGFIVMDGNGSLFGTLSGNTREVLHKFTVDLPKKHGRGGQSALRFARLRLEKRHNYVRKVAETSVQMFITDGQRPNVAGLVVAGSAEFKDKLIDSEMFDPRLKAIILCVVDVSYGALLPLCDSPPAGRLRDPAGVGRVADACHGISRRDAVLISATLHIPDSSVLSCNRLPVGLRNTRSTQPRLQRPRSAVAAPGTATP